MFGFYIHNKFQEERSILNSGNYSVKMKDSDGNNVNGEITYDKEINLLGFNSPMLASKVTLTESFARVICVHFGLSFLFCWHFRLD